MRPLGNGAIPDNAHMTKNMSIQSGTLKFYSQIRRKGGGTVDQLDAPVAASQTINKGDWLKLSSGKVAQAITKSVSANTAGLAGGSPGLFAYALGSITTDANGVATDGTGRTTLPVALLNDDTEIMLGLYNSTAGSSTQGTAGTNLGSNFDLAIVTGAAITQWTYAMSTTTTAPCLTLIEKSPESTTNELYGFVWVKPSASARVGA